MDAGGFNLVIFQHGSGTMQPDVEARLASWVSGGGKLIFNWWHLDSSPTLQQALLVQASSYSTWRDVVADPTCPVNMLRLSAKLDAPVTASDDVDDNGDELTLSGDGYLCGRLGSADGPGAIAITKTEMVNRDQIIVNGFLFSDLADRDNDGDGVADAVELYRNEVLYLLRP